MNNVILLLITVLAFAINNIATRLFQLKLQKSPSSVKLYQSLFCLVAAIAFFISSPIMSFPAAKTLFFGVAFGILFFLAVNFSAKSYECGPMSLSCIVINISFIVPILYSIIFMGESIKFTHIAGIILLIIAFAFFSKCEEGNEKKISGIWFFLVLLAFFSNGATATVQKIFQLQATQAEGTQFMAIAYFVSAAIFAINFFITSKNQSGSHPFITGVPLMIVLSIISGIGSFIGNRFLMTLSTRMNAAVLYSCLNGGLGLFLSVISFLLFKEKVTKMKLIIIGIGILSIIILNL